MSGDKELQRAIENEECFGRMGQPREPMNWMRETNGLPSTTPEAITRKRQAFLRLARRINPTNWLTGGVKTR